MMNPDEWHLTVLRPRRASVAAGFFIDHRHMMTCSDVVNRWQDDDTVSPSYVPGEIRGYIVDLLC